jgi:hypothetical protein
MATKALMPKNAAPETMPVSTPTPAARSSLPLKPRSHTMLAAIDAPSVVKSRPVQVFQLIAASQMLSTVTKTRSERTDHCVRLPKVLSFDSAAFIVTILSHKSATSDSLGLGA